MAINVGSRLKRAWNAFTNRDPPGKNYYGGGSSYRPDRVRLNRANDRTIMTAIYTRIAMDAAGITINHVRLDENGRYDETVDSGLNCCLNLSGNKDQTGRALRYDMFLYWTRAWRRWCRWTWMWTKRQAKRRSFPCGWRR